MVPHAWAGDPDDPQFKAPSFETIGKPIRLKFCKEWYDSLFGVAAKSIPDILDASNWLPADAPVRLKLPSKLKEKLGIQEPEVLSSTPASRPSTGASTESHRKGRKRRPSGWQAQAVPEALKDERHWAAIRLQCKVRGWAALRTSAWLRRRRQAQIRIASYFRGHLTRTGRGDLVPKRRPEKEPLPPELATRLARLDPWSEELNFRHACLGQTGTVHLAPFIKCLQSLQILELCGNYIGSKGIAPLVKMLETQWDLKYLGLAWNGLGDESCRHLAKIIRSRSRLQHLDLRHNRIGDVGSKRLSKAIKGHHSLVQLDLQDNAVAIAGAESLFAACGKRLELNMQNNPVPPEKITQLGATLKEAREKLHLTAFGGGTPGSAKGTLRPPRSREGREGGGRSPARSPAPSAARSPALSTAQSPARSRACSFLPGISKEEIG